MSATTYRALLEQLLTLSEEDLDCNITLLEQGVDEWNPVKVFVLKEDTGGVLDEGHPYIYYKYI
jgi:hypothetical protein